MTSSSSAGGRCLSRQSCDSFAKISERAGSPTTARSPRCLIVFLFQVFYLPGPSRALSTICLTCAIMQRRSITAFNTTFEFSTQYKFVMEFCEEDACPVIVVKQPEGLQWLAIKKIADLDTSHILRKRCLREMKLMSKFYRHHQVASLYAADIVFRSADNVNFNEVYLYRDLELGGTPDRKEALARMGRLRENMKEEDSKSSWTLGADHHQQSFIHDVLRGLRCIHSANVVHCDIRPGSLLVDHRLQVKIYGFGLARRYSPDVPNNRGVSAAKQGFVTVDEETRWYRAPEFILGFENLTPAVDVWSVGCILAELLAGKPIFQGNDYLDQLHKIIDRLGKPSDDMLRRIGSTRLKDYIHSIPTKPPVHFKKLFPRANPLGVSLLEQLLELDPEKRITSEQAIKHPYFDFFRNHLSANVCDSPLDFSFEEEYTAEGTKQLIAKQVRAFSQRDWQQKSWMHSFREKVAGRPPSTGNVSPRAVDEVIWYPPVLEDDVGFGSDAALQPRFRLDDPGAEVERAVANIEIYSEQRCVSI
ncbi:kinase-like protein [Obba rivulosa]|uniref:Kinase-like protein n=1 Tax=Obba rivulosa TaxID=1052685 RepID=A0A8E2B1N0_9APHY|nr:kinase-like protein [Obba rivulosa]